MKKNTKFITFLESMKSHNPALVEAVKSGFKACFESINDVSYDDIATLAKEFEIKYGPVDGATKLMDFWESNDYSTNISDLLTDNKQQFANKDLTPLPIIGSELLLNVLQFSYESMLDDESRYYGDN